MNPFSRPLRLPTPAQALPGRAQAVRIGNRHFVHGTPLQPPFPDHLAEAIFAMGCFWGAERLFWEQDGVFSTAVGYCGGYTPNPTYEEVCSGMTGHAEAVRVIYAPERIAYTDLLQLFWENHDPTQGARQGNDIGTQYRSAIYTLTQAQHDAALASCVQFQSGLDAQGFGRITTQIFPAPEFFYAEDYHQQYLGKNPDGYCGLAGTGVCLVRDPA